MSGTCAEARNGAAPDVSSSYAAEQCRVWLNWAAAQIDACLSGDAAASDQLLASLSAVIRSTDAAPDATAGGMSAVVVAVQFHDRLMQSLRHVAQSLRALRVQIGDRESAASPESWHTLRKEQFRSFSMTEERALFVALVGHHDEAGPETDLQGQSTVDLFGDDDTAGAA
jgi:hypothetical protein